MGIIVGYRVSDDELELLDQKVRLTGLTRSEFLRRLVAAAQVEPVQFRFDNANNRSATAFQGKSATAVEA